MSRFRRRTVAVLLFCIAASRGVADVNADARSAMDRGLRWLKSVQRDNGSWGNENFPAMTALGLWAFARSDDPGKAVIGARAATFIESNVRDDGGIYKPGGLGMSSGGLSTYNTAICMIALNAYDSARFAPVILKARAFLKDSQLVGDSPGAGGFGYEHFDVGGLRGALMRLTKRNRPDLSNTGWALQAMRETQALEDTRSGQRIDIDWQAALDYVSELQTLNPDDPVNHGGFSYNKDRKPRRKKGKVQLLGYGSMTYAGLESMIFAEVDRTDPRVRSALEWAARHWSVDENPGMGLKGLFYYYNIMSKALHLGGPDTLTAPDGRQIAWKQDLVTKLVALQKEDGSWINEDNRFWEGDPVLVTAYAILSIQYALGM